MAKAKKATIKFQKKHLKGAIDKRRAHQKKVQKYNKRNPKKGGRDGADGGDGDGSDDGDAEGEEEEDQASEDEKSKDMSVDQFFNNELDEDEDEEPESDNEDFAGIDTIVEEDDGSDMETPVPKKQTAAEKKDQAAKQEAAHKIQLDALKEKDPEFYKYLQENDQELLEFDGEMEDLESEGDDEDEDEEMASDDAEMEEEEEEPAKKKKSKKSKDVEEEEEMMDGVPLVTKAMVAAWQQALVEKHSLRSLRRLLLAFRAGAHLHDADSDKTYAYKINNPVVFNKLVVCCLKYIIPTFDHHLPTQTAKSGGKPKPLNSGSKYVTLQPLIKSYLQNVLFLLTQLTDQDMIYFVVRESEKAIRYLVGFPKLTKGFLKTKESFKAVYNWQYLHCLGLWSQVVATHALSSAGQPTALHSLIFPLVQVSLGALRLVPTSTYFPLRFQIIRNLLQVVENTGTFIPLAPFLFEVLEGGDMKRPGRKGTLKPLEWDVIFKCNKDYKGSRVYQEGAGEQVYELMAEYYALFSASISFPELAIPAIIQLKRFNKKSGLVKLTKQFAGLVEKLEQNTRFIENERTKADFSPSDASGVSSFLRHQDKEKTPMGAYWKGLKRSVTEKRKLIEDARKDRVAEKEDFSTKSSRRGGKAGKAAAAAEEDDEDDESMDEDDLEEVEDDYDDEE
ncbi:Nucleolar Complex 2 protein [Lunasporangiospora selenospora]|uniref:Nucleolar Complex 2 protein n=1 Tax=Lunasporangiospora selenospora TaxID=979761 RepID=A0A9P6FPH2_9FUNG|nr:Nucleolar Complex 2 protein [Lunasporangiospora selenospora]